MTSPYYLIRRSQIAGYIPDVRRRAREINESMPKFSADLLMRALIARDIHIKGARILVLGITFKENCLDTRNSKVGDLISILSEFGCLCEVFDPRANAQSVERDLGIELSPSLPESAFSGSYDAVILAAPHQEFIQMGAQRIRSFMRPGGVLFDIKSAFSRDESDLRL